MLQLGSTMKVIDGVTVFSDHADPNRFWYLPAPVALADRPDGSKAFTFIKYKPAAMSSGARGGGFLMFETDLKLDDSAVQAIKSALRSESEDPQLEMVPFDEGTVECVALNLQGGGGTTETPAPPGAFNAVEEILGTSVPSLFGDNRALFSLTLSQEGATILEQALSKQAAPIGVIYKLKFTALRPSLHVRITADLERVYNEFSAGLSANIQWASASLEAAFQKLQQDGVIKIKVLTFTADEDVAEQEKWALNFFRDNLLSDWFSPSLSPRDIPAAGTLAPGLPTPTKATSPTSPPAGPGGVSIPSVPKPAIPGLGGGTGPKPPGPPKPAVPGTGTVPAETPRKPTVTLPAIPVPGSLDEIAHQGEGAAPPAEGAAIPPAPAEGGPAEGGPAGPPSPMPVKPPAGPPVGPAGPPAGPGAPPTSKPPTGQPPVAAERAVPAGPGGPPKPPGSPTAPKPPAGPTAAKPAAPAAPATGTAIPQPAKATTGAPTSGDGSALVSLKMRFVHQEERKKLDVTYDRADAVQRTYAPQGYFSLMAGDLDDPKYFIEVDLDDPFFRSFPIDVRCRTDYDRIGLTSVNVALSYGRDSDPGGPKRIDYIFDRTTAVEQKFEPPVNATLDNTYHFRIEYNFTGGSGWEGKDTTYVVEGDSEDRTLEVDPYRHLGFLDVTVGPGEIDPGVVSASDVHLRYEGPDGWVRTDVLPMTATTEHRQWRVRSNDREARKISYHVVHTLRDGSTVATEPVTTDANTVLIGDPFPGLLTVDFVPMWDPAAIRTVFIDLTYTDPANDYRREERYEVPGAQTASLRVPIALRDPELRAFGCRATFVGVDNSSMKVEFTDRTDTLVELRPA